VRKVTPKRPAVDHSLAAGGFRDQRANEALGEIFLVHPGHAPWPEQRATREVVLKREDPSALLKAFFTIDSDE